MILTQFAAFVFGSALEQIEYASLNIPHLSWQNSKDAKDAMLKWIEHYTYDDMDYYKSNLIKCW